MTFSRRKHTKDWRTRRDRTRKLVEAFEKQIGGLVDAYMAWDFRKADRRSLEDENIVLATLTLRVVDVFGECS